MSTETAPRNCRISHPDSDKFINVSIINDDFVIAEAGNMAAGGSARYFKLGIQKRHATDDKYFGYLAADQGFRVQLSLTPEEAEAIHAAIPEIVFKDERVEVQS
jgi:uncharacterized membrane protein